MGSSAFHFLTVTSFLFLFPRRAILIHYRHNYPTFSSDTITFILHDFSQPSFSDMFQGRNHVTSKQRQQNRWRRHSFHSPTMRHPSLGSSPLTSFSSSSQGFAFVYMDDERDAEDAIRGLDRIEFGRKGRRLRVEWTKQERGIRRPGNSRKSSTNLRPSKTLFVINFDPYHTRTRDLERHFDPYGKISNIRIRRNFAFIQFETQEDATKALDATNMSKLMDRVISVEYAIKDDDDRRNGYSPDRGRDKSPGRRRSPSPYRRERASPDYGRGRSTSPYRRERASPDYGRGPSPSPYRRDRTNSDYGRGLSPSPRRERPSPDQGRGPSPRDRVSPDYGHGPSLSPRRERVSPEDYRHGSSPNSKPEPRESPKYGGDESPLDDRYRSRSPLARERSRS